MYRVEVKVPSVIVEVYGTSTEDAVATALKEVQDTILERHIEIKVSPVKDDE